MHNASFWAIVACVAAQLFAGPRHALGATCQPMSLGNATAQSIGSVAPSAMAIADVNCDGRADVIIADGQPQVQVYLAKPTGGLLFGFSLPAGGTARGIAVADIDRDGRPDITTAESGTNVVRIWLGACDGIWPASTAYSFAGGLPQSPTGIVAADFTFDGWTDIVVSADGSGPPPDHAFATEAV